MGPTIIVIGDVHDECPRLRSSLDLVRGHEADLIVLAGDVGQDLPWQPELRRTRRDAHDESVRRVIAEARAGRDCPVVFVPGNHDLPDPPTDVDALNADGRIVECGGLRIAGFGGAGPTPFGFPYEWTEEQAHASLEGMFSDSGPIDIFLSHTPPADTTLDRTAHGVSVGSPSVKYWIERVRPKLFVCGHIHESWGVERIHDVPCLNAGSLGEPYEQEIAWVVSWNDGPERVRSYRRLPGGEAVERIW